MRIQKVINVGQSLKFVENSVKLVGIGAEDIVDGNLTLILGFIWTIILRYQIQDISEEELSAKEGLLLWCQKKTKPYNNVNVHNFHMSFQDGLAFCALIHAHRPDLIPYDTLSKANKKENLQLAFEVAEKHLDIPQILDPEDIVSIPKPDERSIMTYVAALYHVFASSRKAETAAKNVANVLEFIQEAERLKAEYNDRAKQLVDWINLATGRMNDHNFKNSLEGIQQDISDFQRFKSDEKVPKGKEKKEIEANYNTLQTKLRVNNRPPFVPPKGLSPEAIDKLWELLNQAERERARLLREELRRQKYLQICVERFRVKASALEAWVKSKHNFMKTDGVGDSLAAVQAKLKNHETFEEDYNYQAQRLVVLQALLKEIVDGKHREAGWCNERYKDVSNQHGVVLRATADERKAALDAELERQERLQEMLLSFAKKALEFARAVEDNDDILTDPISVNTVEGVEELQGKYEQYLSEAHASAQQLYEELVNIATEIKNAGSDESHYSEYSIDDINAKWNNTQSLSQKRKSGLDKEVKKQQNNENLRVQFASKAEDVNTWINEKKKALEANKGSLESQLQAAQQILSEIQGYSGTFKKFEDLNRQLEAAEITENSHTELTFEGLQADYDGVAQLAVKEIKILENEIIAKKHAGISPDELNEFKECFDHFDKNKRGTLDRLELKACLASLGQDPTDAEIERLLNEHGDEQNSDDGPRRVLSFEAFVDYMKSKHSQSDSPAQIKEQFRIMAADKEFITEAELRAVLPADKANYLVANMPKTAGGYDYKAFVDTLFAK